MINLKEEDIAEPIVEASTSKCIPYTEGEMKLLTEDNRQDIEAALDEGKMLALVTLDTLDPDNWRAREMALDSLAKILKAKELIK